MVNLFLFILAISLFIILAPLGLVYSIVFIPFRGLCYSEYFWRLALSFDQTGNVFMSVLFNDFMIKKGGHRFGNPDENISYVLGNNKKTKTLYKLGSWLAGFLNFIDKNHVEKAVNNG